MNAEDPRQHVLPAARSVVIKIGTAVLTDERGLPDLAFLERMANQVAGLVERGMRVTLVCSGAVGAGMGELGLERSPEDLAHQQAVAAVGQSRLMSHWRAVLTPHNLRPAQLLLTRQDFESRQRFLNIRGCIGRLHRAGCIPVANENDTVAVEELRFGDNDMLAALLCNAMRADALIVLTSVDGLLDEHRETIPLVSDMAAARNAVAAGTSTLGRGGMASKLEAAQLVSEAGEIAVVAHGRTENVLPRLFAGEEGLGTVVAPGPRKLDARRRWIGLTRRAAGTISVDEGAARALEQEGRSLLAIGTTGVHGHFEKGAVVRVLSPDGRQIARGAVNFGAEELARIAGQRSEQIPHILGRETHGEVIHRDNLIRRNVS